MVRFSLIDIRESLLALVLAAAICSAQQISIGGTVKNSSGAGIAGATVTLEKAGKTVTTDSKGKFFFGAVGNGYNGDALQNKKLEAHLSDGILFLNASERGAVEIAAYTLNGQAVSVMKKILDAGTHGIPSSVTGTGVHLYRIRAGKVELLLKISTVGGVSVGSAVCPSGIVRTADRVDRCVRFDDFLSVKKEGYLDYRILVKNPDTSGIEVAMIDCAGTVTDADGNVYQSVKIGDQVWTTGNLKTTKYNDSTPIPQVTDGNKWKTLTTPAYCYNENKPENGKNGVLYNWYVASSGKIAPKGWRVPTRDDQLALRNYLIANGYNYDGTKEGNKVGKSMAAKTGWIRKATNEYDKPVPDTIGMVGNDPNTNNRSGFSALPNGSRWNDGSFHALETSVYWWNSTPQSSDDGWHTSLHTWFAPYGDNHHHKRTGFAIRLIKN